MTRLRKWLFAGLLVLLPIIITLWVLEWVVTTLDQTLRVLPPQWQPETLLGVAIPGLGVLFALLVLVLIGALASTLWATPSFAGGTVCLRAFRWCAQFTRGSSKSPKPCSPTKAELSQAVLVQWPRSVDDCLFDRQPAR